MEWIFDGIGTELISLAVGLILGAVGGVQGYKIKLKHASRQKQVGGNGAKQLQKININSDNSDTVSVKKKKTVNQYQKSGKNSIQIQVGEIEND